MGEIFGPLGNLPVDVGVHAKDGTAINQDLGKEVEHTLVYLSRGRQQQGGEGEESDES